VVVLKLTWLPNHKTYYIAPSVPSYQPPFSREIGNIIRSLGCYPSEADVQDVLDEVEEDEPTEFIRLEKFQPIMAKILQEKR